MCSQYKMPAFSFNLLGDKICEFPQTLGQFARNSVETVGSI